MFGGQLTGAAPFAPDDAINPTAVAYAGDTNNIEREISRGERISTNISGDRAFPAIFADLIAFRDNLRSNAVSALATDAVVNALDDVRVQAGSSGVVLHLYLGTEVTNEPIEGATYSTHDMGTVTLAVSSAQRSRHDHLVDVEERCADRSSGFVLIGVQPLGGRAITTGMSRSVLVW